MIRSSRLLTLVFLLPLLLLTACSGGSSMPSATTEGDTLALQYATLFHVTELPDGVRLVEVGEEGEYHFALVPQGQEADLPEGYVRVEVPIRNTLCMTALQLSNFTALDAHDFVRGLTGTKNLYNPDILQRVADGRIQLIGMEGNFDTERILAAAPDVIFISPFKRGGYEAIKETGITLVPHLGYKELHPLGQAEWIKFIALFIGKEAEADSLFRHIEEEYNALKTLTAEVDHRPTVLSGEMHGANWYAVGGRSTLAQMFHDAGADYVLRDNEDTGGVNLQYEELFAVASQADYWRILNSFHGDFSYEALRASDPRNADFKAWKERHVIYCNMRQTPYYETAPVSPHLLLEDLVAIFHPELVESGYEPTYYHLLQE